MSITIAESVKKSIAFIESNLQNDIGVWDVANSVSYSQFYFSREFSRHTQISIYDYILKRKISESYKYLFATNSKIVDLAFRYGFQSHEVYTRAFRKMFGENPSEAAIYKPLAVFEAIDEHYLAFLQGLKVETIDNAIKDCFFEATQAVEFEAVKAAEFRATPSIEFEAVAAKESEADSVFESEIASSFLVLLSKEHLLRCKSFFIGSLGFEETKFLTFKLGNLKHKIRIYHNDVKLSFRYFINNFYDANEMSSNYILIKKEKDYIDIIIPQ
jgi:AraC-like DNA-binding protein